MLYGAEYFTEDEWIKIDGLVHKGRYVFTRGPPNNVLEDQPLMTFEDTNEEPKLNGHLTTTNSLPEHTSSSSSGHAQSILGETPNEASPEASSDEEAYHFISTSLAEPSPMFDFSEHKSPVSSENTSPATSEPTEISKVNHLPPGCTQEQLDEIKAFNATLTKAGQKTRPKYAPVDEYPSSNWTAEPSGEANQENRFPSPAPTEREARISSWASEVDAAEQTTVEIAAPEPLAAQEIFKKIHGRAPKNTNDFWQPNNPNFRGPTGSKRSESRASNKTARTTKSVAKSVAKSVISPPARVHDGPRPHLQVASGTILKAQTEAAAKGIQLQVSPGDQIQVLTHVSGVMHMGVNLRTKKRGQFSEAIFKKAPDEAVVGTSHTGQKAPVERESVVHRSVQNGLDAVEAGNAAEWEEESVFNSKASESQVESDRASEWNTVPIAPRVLLKNPTTLAAKPAGLAASRFSVLADMRSDTKSQSELSAGPLEITPEMRKEVGKIIDNKVPNFLSPLLCLRNLSSYPETGRGDSQITRYGHPPDFRISIQAGLENSFKRTTETCGSQDGDLLVSATPFPLPSNIA